MIDVAGERQEFAYQGRSEVSAAGYRQEFDDQRKDFADKGHCDSCADAC